MKPHPCPTRARDWPRLEGADYDAMVAFFERTFPYAVTSREMFLDWNLSNPLFAWLQEHMGDCAVGHGWDREHQRPFAYWTRGAWVFDTVRGNTTFRFLTENQAFEFKMRWG